MAIGGVSSKLKAINISAAAMVDNGESENGGNLARQWQ
jgi:hypothetical protein